MSFKIYWTSLAEISFADELEYIFKKWNVSEVGNFIVLTEEFFKILGIIHTSAKKSVKTIF